MLYLPDPIIILLVAMLLLLYQLFLFLPEHIISFIDYRHPLCSLLLSLSKLIALLLLQCLHIREIFHELVVLLF